MMTSITQSDTRAQPATFHNPAPAFSAMVALNGSALESIGAADYEAFIYALVPAQYPTAWSDDGVKCLEQSSIGSSVIG